MKGGVGSARIPRRQDRYPKLPAIKPTILAQSPSTPRRDGGLQVRTFPTPGQWLLLGVLSLSAVAAFGIAPDTVVETVPTRIVERVLPAPQVAEPAGGAVYWREERVQRGDTIGALLARAGVEDPAAMNYLRSAREARPIYQLRPGRAVHVAVDDEGDLVAIRFLTGSGEQLTVSRTDDGFRADRNEPVAEVRTALRSGEIRSSLFGAADAAGIPDQVIIALADIFAADIDFYHDVKKGDRFTVVYETRHVDGEPVGTGRILAAEFVNNGVAHRAFQWRDGAGNVGYYDDNGRSSRSAFLRSPMEFSRVTSGFTMARFHPILKTWREHKGVDYAAPAGTPVRATADGTIAFAGWQNGYGNVIYIRHQGAYSTVYGHLSKLAAGLGVGDKVAQGDIIGYVGMTGWATGPHLHYEFRIADQPHDPLALDLPVADPVTPERYAAFREAIAPLVESVALARSLSGSALAARE